MSPRVLVTAALPYANGPIHLGHLLEAIQTDVYVRARKLSGENVVFMWADDTHGTPIQIRAQRENISPEELIKRAYEEHLAVYRGFNIGFDIFHTTHSEESRRHCNAIFEAMQKNGDISVRDIDQLYCPHDKMFLPDRFVRGGCPKCDAPDQYGDVCEVCGSIYQPTDLKQPTCALCGRTPELRSSSHLFVPLSRHSDFLKKWTSASTEGAPSKLQPSVRNYVQQWIDGGLRDWDISRDAPYFGFEIPGYPGKYFYVWFDAPIGYIAATDRYCAQEKLDFTQYWKTDPSSCEIVHVIGKDIVYFHCLFWPAMLASAGYTTPSRVQVHGWLTVDGEKMSKSRGTFVLGQTYLDHLDPSYLRYYLAAKLSAEQDDLDLNLEDFANRVNADLVNKAANLASRCIKFIVGKLGGTLGDLDEKGQEMFHESQQMMSEVSALYKGFESGKALRLAMQLAETCNLYLTEQAPWKVVAKDPERARQICSAGVQVSMAVALVLKPVLPQWAEKMERMLNLREPLSFDRPLQQLSNGHQIQPYETLAERLDINKLRAMIEAGKPVSEPSTEDNAETEDSPVDPLSEEVSIDAFMPVDLRVGKIMECEKVEGSKKLLRLQVSLGVLGMRTIFSGIAQSYEPESLLGKNVVVFANLKPRKMRFGVSQGMILASGDSDDAITLLELGSEAILGTKIS